MLCDSSGVALRIVLSEPDSQAPAPAPPTRAAK